MNLVIPEMLSWSRRRNALEGWNVRGRKRSQGRRSPDRPGRGPGRRLSIRKRTHSA